MDTNAETSDLQSILQLLRNGLVLLTAYLYFTGFTYVYFWSVELGIPSIAQSITFQEYFIYSWNVVFEWWYVVALFIVVCLFALAIVRSKVSSSEIKFSVFALLILIGFFGLYFLANSTAKESALQIRQGSHAKIVQLEFKSDRVLGAYPSQFQAANTSRNLRLLAESKESVFVLHQPPQENGLLPMGDVYEVPKSELVLIKTELRQVKLEDAEEVSR